jgi:hypothetical protein
MKNFKIVVIMTAFFTGLFSGCQKKENPGADNSTEALQMENQKQYSDWTAPVLLSSVINTNANEQHPFLSKDGLSLFFTSDRTGTTGNLDIWVSERENLTSPWGTPHNLGPNINTTALDMAPTLSPDEHWMYFHSARPGAVGGVGDPADLYVSHRSDRHNNLDWEPAVNLGSTINGICEDAGPTFYENKATGQDIIYFNTRRPVSGTGPCDELHIWQSVRNADGSWGAATYVPQLSSTARDTRTAIRRRDGLEIIISSGRSGGQGGQDLWTSTRNSTLDPWGQPVNLGPTINTSFFDGAPALSFDAKTLIFFSNRPGGQGANDLYMSTRTQVNGSQ